jgi:transposase
MRPAIWQPPVALSPIEQTIVRRVRRAKLVVFLRQQRHVLLDVPFQEELAGMYADLAKGQPPISPARLALATILQAYMGASDEEAVEACVMDRRRQLVLDCLDCADAPFSTGTLVAFRERLIAAEMDRRLIERTVEVAAQTKGFGHQRLRLALDSSPLWGAGRVEDTLNLLGHALRKAVVSTPV